MKYFYDLHIHSDLSPCGNEDMTPNNIVNMAFIKGLNIISVTDHNSTENLPAIMNLCEKVNIEAIPGIEVTTKEEVHVLCYFRQLNYALEFGRIIYNSLPDIKNVPSIFGHQNIYNYKDEITGELNKLLINATMYSLKEVCILAEKFHGVAVPAHINKKSNSLLGILGFIPYDLRINFVEVNANEMLNDKLIGNLKILKNSDAHMLSDISEAFNFVELSNIKDIYNYLKIV